MPSSDPNVVTNGSFTRTYYLVAALPAASAANVGMELFVTDANAHPGNNFGSLAAGGGSFRARVRSDGSVWKLHGGFGY